MNPRKSKRPMALYGGHANRSWYSIKASSEDEVEILIYDEIGFWGITAKDFVTELKGIQAKSIHVRINSPGGEVFDGVAILNALREHPAKVKVTIDSLAASIASIIALAGDERVMAANAHYMIHNPWWIAIGDAADMRKAADILDRLTTTLVHEYMNATGKGEQQIRQWMSVETWFDADEAVEQGFATAKADASGTQAKFDLSVFNNAPAGLGSDEVDEPTEREIETALREAGLSKNKAAAIVAAGKHVLRGEPGAKRGDPALAGLLAKIEAGTAARRP